MTFLLVVYQQERKKTYGAHRAPKITLHKPDTGSLITKMKSASRLLVEEKQQ